MDGCADISFLKHRNARIARVIDAGIDNGNKLAFACDALFMQLVRSYLLVWRCKEISERRVVIKCRNER
jgi:23S rRNA maturation mini-RNase III